jgi:hypothetical protein
LSEPRRVSVSIAAIRSLTILEIARASAIAGVKRTDTERLLRTLVNPDTDPRDLEQGATLLYAWAYQLVKRDEPAATWEEAQTWRVEFDLETVDELADAEADAAVRAAVATGLPPREAGELTLRQMDTYAELAASSSKARR